MTQLIRDLIEEYHSKGWFNGSALVVHKGEKILEAGYGLANMEWNIENTPNTKFRIGSLTKQFTSMLVMQLVAEGRLSTSDCLSTLLPWYRQDTGTKITLHQLLNHTSGIPSFTSRPAFMDRVYHNPHKVEDFVRIYCSEDLEFEPGTKQLYNNSGYFILGAIIERYCEKSFEQVLHERILTPLGMKNSGCDSHGTILSNRAAGYECTLDGFTNTTHIDMSITFSAGNMYSTIEDMHLWHEALYEDKLLSPDLKKIMFTPGLNNYAYGWNIRRLRSDRVGNFYAEPLEPHDSPSTLTLHTHQGGINGFHTVFLRVVEDNTLIVLLNNTGMTVLDRMVENILSGLYGLGVNAVPLPSAQALYKVLQDGGIEKAQMFYAENKESLGRDVKPPQMILLCKDLLKKGMPTEARALLELVLADNPEDMQVYDLIAECMLASGKREEAIKHYAAALIKYPGVKAIIDRLAKLT